MSTSPQRTRLAAFKDFHASQGGSGDPTIALSDADAVALVAELAPEELAHADRVAAGVALLGAVGAPPSVEQEDALAAWAQRKRDASQVLWDGLSGTVVDGVTIIRKRS